MEQILHTDPLESMSEDRDILGLMDPEETADVLRSLHDVLDKDVDMEIDPDDINNNSIIPDSLCLYCPDVKDSCNGKTLQDSPTLEESGNESHNSGTASSMEQPSFATATDVEVQDSVKPTGDSHNLPDTSNSQNESSSRPGLRRSTRNKEYNLRTSSIKNRIETEERRITPKRSTPKNNPAPLSKYRRKTANTRERSRMQEINDAFVELQNVVPDLPSENGKLTKITTLRLAMNYISALREMLGHGNSMEVNCDSPGQSMAYASPGSSLSSTPGGMSESPRTSMDSDRMSVSVCSPGERSLLDSEGESVHSS